MSLFFFRWHEDIFRVWECSALFSSADFCMPGPSWWRLAATVLLQLFYFLLCREFLFWRSTSFALMPGLLLSREDGLWVFCWCLHRYSLTLVSGFLVFDV